MNFLHLAAMFAVLISPPFVHEGGHWLACKMVGAKTYGFTLAFGIFPALKRDYAKTRWANAFISAAGPLASLLAAALLWNAGMYEAQLSARFHLAFSTDLLPITKATDGASIIRYLRAQ